MGEGDDETFGERVWHTAAFSTAATSGGEVGAFDSGRGENANGSGCLVLRKVSLSRVALAADKSGKVPGLRRLSMAV